MRERAKDFPEVIARLVDTHDDGDMDNPVTAGLVEELSKCDLIIGGVMGYITDQGTIHNDAFWYGAYVRAEGGQIEPSQLAQARQKLAEMFGAAHADGLQVALDSAIRSRQWSDNERQRAWEEKFEAQRRMRDAEDRARNLEHALAKVCAVARAARDNRGDALGSSILGLIAEYEEWDAIVAKEKDLSRGVEA